jgi:hypothetical protein
MSETKRLKFAPEFVHAIIDGRKWATIRYDLDSEIHPGDRLELVDAERGEVFARAAAGTVSNADAEWVANFDHNGHRSYDSEADLLSELRGYYPDAELTASTQLTMIELEKIRRSEDYDLDLDPRERRPEEIDDGG